MQAQLIVIMSRHLGEERCWEELEAAIDFQDQGVVAVDLAGDEGNFPGQRFRQHFERARAAGFRITVHAGEAAGPESVRQAIEELGAERLGHAVHAIEDAAVLDLIAARGVVIESCPTSNIQTSTVPSYAAHPLPAFLRRGLLVTLASDDPGISAIDLPYEYRVARDQLGLTPDELRRIQANGVAAAFLSAAERDQLWRDKEQRTKNKEQKASTDTRSDRSVAPRRQLRPTADNGQRTTATDKLCLRSRSARAHRRRARAQSRCWGRLC